MLSTGDVVDEFRVDLWHNMLLAVRKRRRRCRHCAPEVAYCRQYRALRKSGADRSQRHNITAAAVRVTYKNDYHIISVI